MTLTGLRLRDSDSGGRAVRERRGGDADHLVLAIWALTVLTAFLFGSTIGNLIITKRIYEGAKSQIAATKLLNESMIEVRKSVAELSAVLRDAQDIERDGDDEGANEKSLLGEERI